MVKMMLCTDRDDWLARRGTTIGGSEASAVMGMNPYKSNLELWLEKKGKLKAEDIGGKPYVKYGTEAEKYLRGLFALDHPELTVRYMENNLWTNTKYKFAHASLDGWLEDENGRQGILEIKTTEILRSQQKELWKDRIPDNYYVQLLHYLLVTEFDFAVLRAQLKTVFDGTPYLQIKEYRLERSEAEEDIAALLEAEKAFAKSLRSNKKPAMMLPEI